MLVLIPFIVLVIVLFVILLASFSTEKVLCAI